MGSRTPASTITLLAILPLLFTVPKHVVADNVHVNIDVVGARPERATILAMATVARLVAVEPGKPLGVGAALCRAGGTAVIVGASGLAAGGAGAAARAGRTLLLVDPTPALPPARLWSVLAMYPHEDVLAEAGKAICAAKGWQRAVLLHEGPASPAARLAPDDDLLVLSARALPPPDDEALLRNLLLVLKKSGASNFVVWCDAACCVRVLGAAQRVGMLAERHSYLLLTLDLHTQALDPFSHGGANLTTLRLFDTNSEAFTDFTRDLSAALESTEPPEEVKRALSAPSTALVLAWDAARWVRAALTHLALPAPATPDAADCSAGVAAHHADTLLNYLRSEQQSGASGEGRWEADGARRAVQLLLTELHRGGDLEVVGSWSREEGVVWTRNDPPAPPEQPDSMTNRTFTVLIAKNPPYVMMRESAERLSGNEQYEGFCIELIEKLAEQLNFNYTFIEQRDGKYGNFDNSTGKWNGMMLELMTKPDVHFAITDLTITAEREQKVDFTTPFMNLGISILFKMPKAPEPETFAFMLPFSSGVWLCLGLAYVGTSLLLYVVGRLSPEEWQNPYPCVDDPPALDNQFTLANALWFNLGAVLLQGSEIAPVAYSTRAVASVWWLFALVITSSYTANLATLLAKKAPVDIIKNVEELAHNGQIEYGAKDGGSTYTFFQHSQNKLYKEMYEVMKTKEMPKDNPEGIQRVMMGNYAFLMESTTIEHETQRNCDVVQVGDLLDNKGYGIAMRKKSPYRQALNLALLNLQERGVLREMKNKWWNELHGGGRCKAVEGRGNERLNMKNFTGLFLVLVVGCAVGLVGALAELAWVARSRPAPAARPYWRRLGDELRFVFQFDRSVKPLRPEPSSSPTTPSPAPPMDQSTPPAPATRSGSPRSGHWSVRRRRSSMAAASARRARHTTTADSSPAAAAAGSPQRQ